jgi:WhiB family transcriptional regulator, redox-sensing transcriptional regulator
MSRTRTLTPQLARQIQNDPRYGEALSHRVPEPGWRARARCLEHDPELFFSAAAEDPGPAMAICGDCAVRGACLAAALNIGDCDGVWGGTAPAQRRTMRLLWVRTRTDVADVAASA